MKQKRYTKEQKCLHEIESRKIYSASLPASHNTRSWLCVISLLEAGYKWRYYQSHLSLFPDFYFQPVTNYILFS